VLASSGGAMGPAFVLHFTLGASCGYVAATAKVNVKLPPRWKPSSGRMVTYGTSVRRQQVAASLCHLERKQLLAPIGESDGRRAPQVEFREVWKSPFRETHDGGEHTSTALGLRPSLRSPFATRSSPALCLRNKTEGRVRS